MSCAQEIMKAEPEKETYIDDDLAESYREGFNECLMWCQSVLKQGLEPQ